MSIGISTAGRGVFRAFSASKTLTNRSELTPHDRRILSIELLN